ncbi:MAG: methyltransferase domain-containing protein [Actinomycetota bacterium]|nr:methyltransferase domain-containing protein [Actinomycetota bacterium]
MTQTKREYWHRYWSGRSHGGHRYGGAEFLRRDAQEKLMLLEGGGSLLDFGCGAGEVLQYLAPSYAPVLGVDFSPAMLAAARARLDAEGLTRVGLLQADDTSVWRELPHPFSRIAAGQVIQYLDDDALGAFLTQARAWVEPGGRVALFDVIDPRLGYLFALGLLGDDGRQARLGPVLFRRALRHGLRASYRALQGLPREEMGVAHHPARVRDLAAEAGFACDIVWSRYYEYRFHALLREAPHAARTAR